jgi:hypothetical protein
MQTAGDADYDFGRGRFLFSALQVRDRLIAKLALLAGMRPGEFLASNGRG